MIVFSDKARARALHFMAKSPEAKGVLIAVKRGGCSGYGYEVAVVSEVLDALQFDMGGFLLFVRYEDEALLKGLKVDVKKEGLNERFVFDNPQAQATCGCGTSFSI